MSSSMYELPEHLEFPVTANGEGPAEGNDIARWVCWTCLDEDWPCSATQENELGGRPGDH